jgi:hypothetical protein
MELEGDPQVRVPLVKSGPLIWLKGRLARPQISPDVPGDLVVAMRRWQQALGLAEFGNPVSTVGRGEGVPLAQPTARKFDGHGLASLGLIDTRTRDGGAESRSARLSFLHTQRQSGPTDDLAGDLISSDSDFMWMPFRDGS